VAATATEAFLASFHWAAIRPAFDAAGATERPRPLSPTPARHCNGEPGRNRIGEHVLSRPFQERVFVDFRMRIVCAPGRPKEVGDSVKFFPKSLGNRYVVHAFFEKEVRHTIQIQLCSDL
jgi:hypothetical protein